MMTEEPESIDQILNSEGAAMETEDKRTNVEVLIEHLADSHVPLDITRDYSESDWHTAFDAIRMHRARWNSGQ
jgi:hypothetical protein